MDNPTNDKPLAGVVRAVNKAYPHGGDNNQWRATIIQRESGIAELVEVVSELRKTLYYDDYPRELDAVDAALRKLTGDTK